MRREDKMASESIGVHLRFHYNKAEKYDKRQKVEKGTGGEISLGRKKV